MTRREFYDFVLIFFYSYFFFFFPLLIPTSILSLLRHQTVKLTPDGKMSFRQLRASLLLLPAIEDSFLHVRMGNAGGSKAALNAGSVVSACSQLTKFATTTVSV